MMLTVEVYERSDHKYAWRCKAANNLIVATDGGQGYNSEADAETMAVALFNFANEIALKRIT